MKANLEDKLWEQVRRYNMLSEEYKKMADELTTILIADSEDKKLDEELKTILTADSAE